MCQEYGKKVLGKAAMAVLAASLAMTTLPVYSYADVNYTIENLINAHGETISNVKVIDISKATISNGKISILIEEDGAYMLKGRYYQLYMLQHDRNRLEKGEEVC